MDSGFRCSGRTQTAAEMSRIAHGHAMPLKIVPTCEGVPEPEKRLKVSPTAVIAIAPATSSH